MGPRQQVGVSWSAGAPLIANMKKPVSMLWMLAFQILGTQKMTWAITQLRDTAEINILGITTKNELHSCF